MIRPVSPASCLPNGQPNVFEKIRNRRWGQTDGEQLTLAADPRQNDIHRHAASEPGGGV